MKNLRRFLVIMIVFAFAGAGAFSTFVWFNRDIFFPPDELDSDLILQNIFRNNPQSLLSTNLSKSAVGARNSYASESMNATVGEDSALGMPAPEYLQDVKTYNYNYTKTTTTPGPKSSACTALYAPEKKQVYENYDYFDENQYYYKSISKDSSDEIISYYLEKGDESYQYQGGMYAVKTLRNNSWGVMKADIAYETDASAEESVVSLEDEMIAEPVDNTTSSEVLDKSYFGEDTLVEEVTENGIKYYVATWSYETNCDLNFDWKAISSSRMPETVPSEGTETTEDLRTIYVKSWSRADDYQIVKQETYVDSVDNSNLVSTTTTEMDSRDAVLSEVASEFTFDLSVPVKEIDTRTDYVDPYSDIDGYLSYMGSYIADAQIKILDTDNSDFLMTSAYFNSEYGKQDEWYGYVIDRDYYADTAEGLELYNQAVENYWLKPGSMPMGSVDYSNSDYSKSISIAIFDDSISDDDIWNNYGYRGEDMSSLTKTIKVDGEDLSVKEYYWDSSYVISPEDASVGSSSGSAGSGENSLNTEIIMDEKPYVFAQLYALISRNGFKYLINYYGSGEAVESVVLPNLVTKNLTVESVRTDFLNELKETYSANREVPVPVVDTTIAE